MSGIVYFTLGALTALLAERVGRAWRNRSRRPLPFRSALYLDQTRVVHVDGKPCAYTLRMETLIRPEVRR